jgi:hypothetical protein
MSDFFFFLGKKVERRRYGSTIAGEEVKAAGTGWARSRHSVLPVLDGGHWWLEPLISSQFSVSSWHVSRYLFSLHQPAGPFFRAVLQTMSAYYVYLLLHNITANKGLLFG